MRVVEGGGGEGLRSGSGRQYSLPPPHLTVAGEDFPSVGVSLRPCLPAAPQALLRVSGAWCDRAKCRARSGVARVAVSGCGVWC